jgi:hypothetical protein
MIEEGFSLAAVLALELPPEQRWPSEGEWTDHLARDAGPPHRCSPECAYFRDQERACDWRPAPWVTDRRHRHPCQRRRSIRFVNEHPQNISRNANTPGRQEGTARQRWRTSQLAAARMGLATCSSLQDHRIQAKLVY